MASYRSDSMYRNTRIVNNKYLDVLEPSVENPNSYNTYPLVIGNKYDQRPDLLAYDLYGNAKLWWVFAQFNQDLLLDPIIDFRSGIEIQVPRKFS
jgi:hypothetical protein